MTDSSKNDDKATTGIKAEDAKAAEAKSSRSTSTSDSGSSGESMAIRDQATEEEQTAQAAEAEPLVRAKPGSLAETKTAGAVGVDHRNTAGPASFNPQSADAINIRDRVSEDDPNYVEAARKLDPEAVGLEVPEDDGVNGQESV